MTDYHFMRVACAVPVVSLADPITNGERILDLCEEALQLDADVILFPELSITGCSCGDLFEQKLLVEASAKVIERIVLWSEGKGLLIVVGSPIPVDGTLYDCAVVINNGQVLGAVPKTILSNGGADCQRRWFRSGANLKATQVTFGNLTFLLGNNLLFRSENPTDISIGIEIGEDINAHASIMAERALIILNPFSDCEIVGKRVHRHEWVKQQSIHACAVYCTCSAGFGESTTDLVFSGDAMICEMGTVLAESQPFAMEGQLIIGDIDTEALLHDRRQKMSFTEIVGGMTFAEFQKIPFHIKKTVCFDRKIASSPFVPEDAEFRKQRCQEVLEIQTMGLVSRLRHIGCPPMVVGISGGLDSTLALLVCVNACDALGLPHDLIHAVTMPGFGTTDRTYDNAVALIKGLGASFHEIPIKEACTIHFKDIGHDIHCHDVTYENAQARERTQVLMDLSNKLGGFVVGTGDLSELALGWATYNGDHMSMYAVNADVPKTLIRHVVAYCADQQKDETIRRTLYDVLDTPVSPELLPPDEAGDISQKTEDLVGPYELHDFFLYYALRYGFTPQKIFFLAQRAFSGYYDDEIIYKWLRNFYWRFFSQQFKRSCLPDGPKVGIVGVSPRGDWCMPSDAKVKLWMQAMDKLKETL